MGSHGDHRSGGLTTLNDAARRASVKPLASPAKGSV